MAPLKVMVIIWGTWAGSMFPGTLVPSDEQKQSGSWHWLRSQSGARLGSESTPQAVSSEPSEQSCCSSQNNFLSMHSPFPHWSCSSGQTGSSVLKFGRTLLGSTKIKIKCVYKYWVIHNPVLNIDRLLWNCKWKIYLLDNRSQLSTFDFQSQVCLSMSKARPAGQRTAAKRIVPARPARSHLQNFIN